MKAALYQDLRGGTVGGGEYSVAVLAQALVAKGLAVDFVHHQDPGFVDKVAGFFGMDLSSVGDRPLPRDTGPWFAPDAPLWRRASAMRDWQRDASDGYDVFVCVTHRPPPYCHARTGLLYVLFPLFDRRQYWQRPADRSLKFATHWLRRRIHERLWQERFRSYRTVSSISEYSQKYTRDYWGVDSSVVYPPVDIARFETWNGVREKRIAVLGRFSPQKMQLELVRAFANRSGQLSDWTMVCLGGVGSDSSDREYFSEVERAAGGAAVELIPNASPDRLRAELCRSQVFWHAMGLTATVPEAEEHFGIATVEAMAAGCIPVVPNRGGQPEIVADGETGYVCDSLTEYVIRTAELEANPVRAATMSQAARKQATVFAVPKYIDRMMSLLGQ